VRLSECDFGSSNLRWMAIFACNILYDDNYQDMWDKRVLPINDDLHLLLSARTAVYMWPNFGEFWANDMLGKERGGGPQTLIDAWEYAGKKTQPAAHPSGPVIFRVAGWHACLGDKLLNYSTPDSGDPTAIEKEDRQVYP
jgi:Family of unknown function (DUF6345)